MTEKQIDINKQFWAVREKHEAFVKSKGWKFDHDKIDFKTCRELLKKNNRVDVEKALKKYSPGLSGRHKDADKYAFETVKKAFDKNLSMANKKIERNVPDKEKQNIKSKSVVDDRYNNVAAYINQTEQQSRARNQNEKLKHEDGFSDHYIHSSILSNRSSKNDMKKVSGKSVEIKGFKKIKFFAYKEDGGYHIADKTVGMTFNTSRNKKDSISKAVERVVRLRISEQDLVKDIQEMSKALFGSKVITKTNKEKLKPGDHTFKVKNIHLDLLIAQKEYKAFVKSKGWEIDHNKMYLKVCKDLLQNNKKFKVEQALKDVNFDLLNARHKDVNKYVKQTVNNANNTMRLENKRTRSRDKKITRGLSM